MILTNAYRWLDFQTNRFIFRYHELAKDIKHNKGGILRATVTYVKILKSDQLKKQRLEEICRLQQEQIGVLIDKIRVNIYLRVSCIFSLQLNKIVIIMSPRIHGAINDVSGVSRCHTSVMPLVSLVSLLSGSDVSVKTGKYIRNIKHETCLSNA